MRAARTAKPGRWITPLAAAACMLGGCDGDDRVAPGPEALERVTVALDAPDQVSDASGQAVFIREPDGTLHVTTDGMGLPLTSPSRATIWLTSPQDDARVRLTTIELDDLGGFTNSSPIPPSLQQRINEELSDVAVTLQTRLATSPGRVVLRGRLDESLPQ